MHKNKKNTLEADLLPLALLRLKETIGIEGTILPGQRFDGAQNTRLVLAREGLPGHTDFTVEVKRTAGNAAAAQLAAMKGRYILVTNYINLEQADRFKNMDLQFIDCAGNAYINTASIFVFVKGNKRRDIINTKPARLFKPTGLQAIFALLCNPDLVDDAYREIAERARVALGTVAWVINDLLKQGYCIDIGNKRRRLVKKDALLRLWLAGYEQLLRPRLAIKRYHAEKQDWWQDADPEDVLWGREIAAYKMTGYLKPELVTLYALNLPARMMLQNKIRPDPKGEIELLAPFWDFDYTEKKENMVPPLLVYADLLVQADGRTTETAQMIYDKYLTRYFTEN